MPMSPTPRDSQESLPLPLSTAQRSARPVDDEANKGLGSMVVAEDGSATYGTARVFGAYRDEDGRWRGGRWVIAIDGTARTRMKKWLTGVRDEHGGDLSITRTRETDRALRIFEMEYPLRISTVDRQMMLDGAQEASEAERMARRIMLPSYVPTTYPIQGVTPYVFQRVGADALRSSGALLCADDLGLGKTITALLTLCDGALRPALVVCPANLIGQWKREIARCLPQLTVHELKSTTPYDVPTAWYARAKKEHAAAQRKTGKRPEPFPYSGPRQPDVLITNYHRLDGWANALIGKIKYIIADEVHELRHHDTARYRAFMALRATVDACLALSATPIFNYGGEAHTVLDAVAPGALGTRDEFVRVYCNQGAHAAVTDPRALHHELISRGLMVRRRRFEVGHELPALTKSRICVAEGERRFHDAAKAGGALELARIILRSSGDGQDEADSVARSRAWNSRGQFEHVLRQSTGIAKALDIAETIIMCVRQGERPVVFAHHKAVWRIIMERLNAAGVSFASYTGDETNLQKQAALDAFCKADGVDTLLVSMTAGSAGLDGLQHWSNVAIIGELDYTSARHDQAIARLRRNGQKLPVIAYFVIADFGWDPIAEDIVGMKGAQFDGIFDPSGRADAATHDSQRAILLARSYIASLEKALGPGPEAAPYIHPGGR